MEMKCMFRPQERSQKVVAMYFPDEDDEEEEAYYTLAIWKGKTRDDGEHYLVEYVYPFDETAYIHKEDLYEDTEENREKIPDHVSIMF